MAKPESPTDKHISRVPADLESQGIEEVRGKSAILL